MRPVATMALALALPRQRVVGTIGGRTRTLPPEDVYLRVLVHVVGGGSGGDGRRVPACRTTTDRGNIGDQERGEVVAVFGASWRFVARERGGSSRSPVVVRHYVLVGVWRVVCVLFCCCCSLSL